MNHWTRARFQPPLPLDGGLHPVTAGKAHQTLAREAAREGMVLLKNEGDLLPFPAGQKLAVFGTGQVNYAYGGGGSGEVHAPYYASVYDGLCAKESEGKVELFHELTGFYRDSVAVQRKADRWFCRGEGKQPPLPADLLARAREFTDTALFVLSRYSEESSDRPIADDYNLAEGEAALAAQLKETFPHVAVVLNVGGVVDSSWFSSDPRVQSVLCIWQAGMEGGSAAADLLCGDATPSGKLMDTFASSIQDYPSTPGFQTHPGYVDYTEDIFVGYRYFETFPQAKSHVNYPFGFGLSYTTFSFTGLRPSITQDTVSVTVTVTNTGSRPGREVAQLYFSAPQGCLGKPARELASFQKTGLLAPGASETLTLSFPVAQMASFDDLGKVEKSAFLLEKGTYTFFLGASVRHGTVLEETLVLQEDVILERSRSLVAPRLLPRRLLADGSYESLPTFGDTAPAGFVDESKETFDPPVHRSFPEAYQNKDRILLDAVAEGTATLEEFLAQLSDLQLATLLEGRPNTGMANTFGIGGIPEYGIPAMMTCDGPAGVRIQPECGVRTTAWPSATLMACTFDPELAARVGRAGAEEAEENNLSLWLTPAVNIHRSPLCGRNFEYFSEDPYLTGTMAAATIRGIQSRNVGADLKHFACNNRENNRKECDSRVSERALREIYLRPFRMAVEQARPMAVMTCYNRINGIHGSERRDLLQDILRDEWGFDGIVTSDWWNTAPHVSEILAGNDVKMAHGDVDAVMQARSDGTLTREDLLRCAQRVVNFILRFQ